MYRAAEYLIEAGHAYVDEQTPEEMRAEPGDFGTPGNQQPLPRPHARREPGALSARCATAGTRRWGGMVLRAKIDMASPNINLRDPTIYRIRRATHHNTGDTWCIYPMYTFAHPIEDALEQITHSICTLEFEDQRPFYDWLLARLIEGGLLKAPPPRQYEFARLNLTYVITSKRKLKQLVDEGTVSRLGRPAHAHHRRSAPARLHAREPAPVCRAHRHHQVRRLDRLQHAGHCPARDAGKQGPRAWSCWTRSS
jgi:glutaminyl-tRNA synthetase